MLAPTLPDTPAPSCGHPNHGSLDHDCRPFLACDDPDCPCLPSPPEEVRVADQARDLAERLNEAADEVDPPLSAPYSPRSVPPENREGSR